MSDLLGLGTSALSAAQRMMDTIGHNISNVNTPGYSRQSVDLLARQPVRLGGSFVGTGVEVGSVSRIVDQFLIKAQHTNQANFQELSTFGGYTQTIDNLLADSNLGLSNALNGFFGALSEVNNHPNSIPARQVFLSSAEVLDNRFKEVNTQLSELNNQVNSQLGNIVTRINGLAQSIAGLNSDITNVGASSGSQPNDLLDKRDELVRELSKLVSVTTLPSGTGAVDVFIGSGQALVSEGIFNRLNTTRNEYDPSQFDINLSVNNTSIPITEQLNGGQLGGALMVRSEVISPTLNAIGRLAITVASTFNEQHMKGVDLNGNLGKALFSDPNLISVARDRVLSDNNNTGDALLSVQILPIDQPNTKPFDTFTQASSLVDTGTLNGVANNAMLNLNGVGIRVSAAGDDTSSSVDNAASAIAIARAINDSSAQHGVTASAQPNLLSLGQFTTGAFAAGEFQINGINVVTTGTDSNQLVQDINALSSQTGVEASITNSGTVQLVAADGRNIQLTSNTNTPVATFEHFNTNSATALDQVKRSEVKLSVSSGVISVKGNNPGLVGLSAADYPNLNTSSLTTSDYELSYNGSTYSLLRLNDNAIVGQSISPEFEVDGFAISLDGGAMQAGDKFLIQPTRKGSVGLDYLLTNPSQLALAAPVRVDSDINNQGTGAIQLAKVTNTSGLPSATAHQLGNSFSTPGQLSPPLRIEFTSETTFQVYDVSTGGAGIAIGPEQNYNPNLTPNQVFPIAGVADSSPPGPNATYTFDPGYRINLQGSPKAGDVFTIGYNSDADTDNRNGQQLAALQLGSFMNNSTSTFQESFAQLVGEVGSLAAKTKVNMQASDSLLKSTEARRNEVSGVNLDEEAANLIRFEQYYQAATQLISVARQNFDVLFSAFGR